MSVGIYASDHGFLPRFPSNPSAEEARTIYLERRLVEEQNRRQILVFYWEYSFHQESIHSVDSLLYIGWIEYSLMEINVICSIRSNFQLYVNYSMSWFKKQRVVGFYIIKQVWRLLWGLKKLIFKNVLCVLIYSWIAGSFTLAQNASGLKSQIIGAFIAVLVGRTPHFSS